jgi:hypothetical protein
MTKRCAICKQHFPLDEFNKRTLSADGLQVHCRECNQQASHAYYVRNREKHKQDVKPYRAAYLRRNRELVLDHLSTHPCVDCGEQDIVVLDFDHVRGRKSRDVSKMAVHGVNPEKLLAEIAKCDVRCVNCHRRKTHRDQRTWRSRIKTASPPDVAGSS